MSEVNLNEEVSVVVEDATVITTPIDTTLTIAGDAADAKAVGDALALKADASSVTEISVNGQTPDNQGEILLDGTEIPISSTDDTTLKEAIDTANAKTGAEIPINDEEDADTINAAFSALTGTVTDGFAELTADDSGSITAASGTNATLNTSRCIKIGRMVIVSVNFEITGSQTTGTTLATVPSGFRPDGAKNAIYGMFKRNNNDPAPIPTFSNYTINSSGQIKQNMSSSWTSGWFSAMWIYFV